MSINEKGMALIKGYEKCRLEAYKCQAGVWTIGYGHTGADVKPGLKITQERAEGLFRQDLELFSIKVHRCLVDKRVRRFVNENQFAALVSLTFNIGVEGFRGSTVLRMIAGLSFDRAAEAFKLWNKVTIEGVLTVSDGLIDRREAEMALFNTPVEIKKAPVKEPSSIQSNEI